MISFRDDLLRKLQNTFRTHLRKWYDALFLAVKADRKKHGKTFSPQFLLFYNARCCREQQAKKCTTGRGNAEQPEAGLLCCMDHDLADDSDEDNDNDWRREGDDNNDEYDHEGNDQEDASAANRIWYDDLAVCFSCKQSLDWSYCGMVEIS